MALLHADGFDHYGNASSMTTVYFPQSPQLSGPGGADSFPGRTGSSCLTMYSGSALNWNYPASVNTTIIGLAFNTKPVSGGEEVISLLTAGGAAGICDIGFNTSYGFTIRKGDYGSPTATANTASSLFTPNQWYYLELYYDAPSGNLVIRLNGVVIYSSNNMTTQAAVGMLKCYGRSGAYYMDDLYVCDGSGTVNNTFLGDRRVRLLLPTADTAQADWTPNSGTAGFSRINEIPADGATSFLSSATVGAKSDFDFTDVPTSAAAIAGIVVFNSAGQSDAGVSSFRTNLVTPSGTVTGPDMLPSTSFAYRDCVFERDGGGNPFNQTTINATKIELERRS